MGSKQRIADEILSVIFEHARPTETFADIFCGGCSVIERVDPSKYIRIANDRNDFLIEMFRSLVSQFADTDVTDINKMRERLDEIGLFPTRISKEAYSEQRDLYKKFNKGLVALHPESDIARIGWYGWMGSFNGRFFSGGYAGHEVVIKSGATRDYIREQIDNTLRQVPALKGVNFYREDYDRIYLPTDSIVYCDIPYRGTKQYETSKNFNYENFYEWCRSNRHRYQIFISEYAMPDDFECIWQKSVTTTINPNKTLKPVEKLFRIK